MTLFDIKNLINQSFIANLGCIIKDVFNIFIATTVHNFAMLLKNVETGSVIVMDNATFHRKKELEMLAKQSSCKILFLPPYSPDLNPIEQFCSKKIIGSFAHSVQKHR